MADLNALIAQGYQFQPLPDPFVQYGKMQQLENSATQNRLAQQQMTEGTALAPYRLAEAKAKSGSAELELRQTQEAQDFVTGIMQKIKDNHGGIDDPMEAAYQMSLNVNPKVQAIGKNLADAIQLIEGIKQQRAYAQRPTGSVALAAGPAAAPTAAYRPASTLGTLGGPTPAMPSFLGSGTFDVNAPAPVANAFATSTPSVNAFRPGAVTAESVADQIRQGNATFGNAPGWTKDREILMKQYEALLNPRERTFAPIDSSKYTQASIQAFNASGDQSDLVPRPAEAGKVYAPIIPKDYTPESLKAYGLSGDVSDLIPVAAKADKPTSLISQIDPSKFTPASVAAFSTAGDYSLLVPIAPKSEKIDSTIGKVDPDKFTAKSIAKYAKSNNYEDLVPVPKDKEAKDDPNTTVASTQVDNAGNVTFYNKFGKPINTQKGAGKPSATFEKTAAAKVNLARDLDQAIAELTAVTKDGGLIDQSTGSGVGRAVDVGARFIGRAMPGDIAIGKLQPVADLALKMVPRFEGPQSNADTTSYKQAAGQLADPTLPPEIRKAAGKTVLRLMIARKGQFTTADIPTEGAEAAPTGGGEWKVVK